MSKEDKKALKKAMLKKELEVVEESLSVQIKKMKEKEEKIKQKLEE